MEPNFFNCINEWGANDAVVNTFGSALTVKQVGDRVLEISKDGELLGKVIEVRDNPGTFEIECEIGNISKAIGQVLKKCGGKIVEGNTGDTNSSKNNGSDGTIAENDSDTKSSNEEKKSGKTDGRKVDDAKNNGAQSKTPTEVNEAPPATLPSKPESTKTVPKVESPKKVEKSVPVVTTVNPNQNQGFRKAQRKKAKLRMSFSGFSGSGKTASALLVAYGITKDWSKIAVIDSEGKSAELYVGATFGNTKIGQYDVLEMEPPFSVDKLINAIKLADESGYEVVIIDSASPYWQGEGGALEAHSEATKRGSNSFTAWGPITAKQNRLMDAIIGSKLHVLVTLRSKVEYVMETVNGKTQVKKIGTESIQRQGFIYDMTLQLDLSQDHTAEVVKDRTNLFDGQYFIPTVTTGEKLKEWLEAGIANA